MNSGRMLLGLIGNHISRSKSPALHRICGELAGISVSYNLLSPELLGLSLAETVDFCRTQGYHGVNVTYPFKETVTEMTETDDALIAHIGSVNTVLFDNSGLRGFNTDYLGFKAAFREEFGNMAPGKVALIGAGGVGKAIAFALLELGAEEIMIIDRDVSKAEVLADSLRRSGSIKIEALKSIREPLEVADGIVNATPLGMYAYPGSPVPEGGFPANVWAFDAVYVPVETQFRRQALSAGARFLSGYELFFNQGVTAFEIFTGRSFTEKEQLRTMLVSSEHLQTG